MTCGSELEAIDDVLDSDLRRDPGSCSNLAICTSNTDITTTPYFEYKNYIFVSMFQSC